MLPVVFDLDGTLIDSAPDIHAGANGLLADEGQAPITLAEARSFIGNGAAVFVARMRAVRGIPDSEQPRLHAEFVRRYDDFVSLTHPYPGAVAALHVLEANGHRLGICTNKPHRPTMAILTHLGIAGLFDTILGGDSLPVHKPDPAPLRAAFAALGGPGLFVGDSEVDAETAHAAGVPLLLFSQGYRKAPAETLGAAAIFDDFSTLPALVARLQLGHANGDRPY
ncbi:phosphoglycolate phosphatase [Fertoebacter nigrum]|uniref:Phosphoglycolate phosphatase n=1 Tax=Fertoeibacter niger TaxID=2656921 RepID=A0A8X8H0T6_9RHOB|nr:phosphoglycolate phosphatase [Fertoeibacter niger]NUB46707.1 phosphoglycolate phosphatase [Fertoeibacter niger]